MLLESLFCIALVGLGAIPLAVLGGKWLRWSGEHEQLIATLQLAAERAEAGVGSWPLVSGDPQRAMLCNAATAAAVCTAGNRMALARLPDNSRMQVSNGAEPPTGIALWVSP